MTHEHTMVKFLSGGAGRQGEFIHRGQATVLRGNLPAGGFSVPKRQRIQAWDGKVFAAPCDVNAKDIYLVGRGLGSSRDHINEMLKPADIGRGGVVQPTMNINKKERSLRLPNDIDRSRALGGIEGGAIIAELDESNFVAAIGRPPHGIARL